jgi:lactoylglutathione lyase/glyoxylase I family protein
MITGIAHNCYRVADLEASVEFYRDKLGLKEVFDFVNESGKRTGLYVHVGGRNFIELFEGAVPGQGGSFQHICLEVDDINQAVATLGDRGVDCSEPKLGNDRSWQSWIADPDGNRIELHQYTAESKQNRGL